MADETLEVLQKHYALAEAKVKDAILIHGPASIEFQEASKAAISLYYQIQEVKNNEDSFEE